MRATITKQASGSTPLLFQRKRQKKYACINIIVPLRNEAENLPLLFSDIQQAFLDLPYEWRIVFVDDGSTDRSVAVIGELKARHPNVRLIELSRCFGKEAALTAGIHAAEGDAVLCIDADLQHPPSLIPVFLKKWEEGAEVVIGVRNGTKDDPTVRRLGSFLFYHVMNAISDVPIVPRATDFRLLDRSVVDAFRDLHERNRMTRGLVDWLGFRRELIVFDPGRRINGASVYHPMKLMKLAVSSFISMSLLPLRLAGYLGVLIVLGSGLLGSIMLTDRYAGLGLHFSGPAILATINLFLVGIILVCIGLLAFYIAHIHTETQGRPLYVIRRHTRQ